MQLHQIKPTHKKKRGRRVGRGGKRGTYSGRGVKGQKSRSGRRFKPAVRYLIKRYPKLRGYRFSVSGLKFQTVNLDSLDKSFEPGQTVNPQTLLEKKIVRKINGRVPDVKILGGGKITKGLTVENCSVSKQAKEKIIKVGGQVNGVAK